MAAALCFSALVWWHQLRAALTDHSQGGGGPVSSPAAVPRLTLGLPVYNGERFLAASLDALLAQTFTGFELIISDNGSTDQTGANRPAVRVD